MKTEVELLVNIVIIRWVSNFNIKRHDERLAFVVYSGLHSGFTATPAAPNISNLQAALHMEVSIMHCVRIRSHGLK